MRRGGHMKVFRPALGVLALAVLIAVSLATAAKAAPRTVAPSGTARIGSPAVGSAAISDPEFREEAEDENGDGGHNGPPNPNRPFGRQKKLFPGERLPAPGVVSSGITAGATGFDGLRMFDQRVANGGNQFEVDPPDQAMCVGAGYVVEAVNTVMAVYSTSGVKLAGPQDLNRFYGYPAQFDRTTGQVGPEITDPVCYFDPEYQRFVLVVLTLEVEPGSGDFTGANHLDVAVSKTSDPR